jgi:ABC-2 type transport system permease protein
MKLKALLIFDIKQNYGIFAVIIGVMAMYLSIIINMYDPNGLDELIALAKFKMSSDLLTAFGFDIAQNASLISLITSYFYGMLIYFILVIYVIIVGNRMIVEHVNKGTMGYLLSTPHTRTKIASFQAMFFILGIFLLLLLLMLVGIIVSEISFPGLLDIKAFIMLNLGMFLLFGMFSGISFLSSCIFNDTKNALALGAGLPLLFIIINILSNVDPSLNFLQNLTIVSLLKTDTIISGGNYLTSFLIMFASSFALYFAGIKMFSKRDLSL